MNDLYSPSQVETVGHNLHRGNEIIPFILNTYEYQPKAIDFIDNMHFLTESLAKLSQIYWVVYPQSEGANPYFMIQFASPYQPTPSGWSLNRYAKAYRGFVLNTLMEITVSEYNTSNQTSTDLETFYIYISTYGYYTHTSKRFNVIIAPHDHANPPTEAVNRQLVVFVLPTDISIDMSALPNSLDKILQQSSLLVHSLNHAYSKGIYVRRVKLIFSRSYLSQIVIKGLDQYYKPPLFNFEPYKFAYDNNLFVRYDRIGDAILSVFKCMRNMRLRIQFANASNSYPYVVFGYYNPWL